MFQCFKDTAVNSSKRGGERGVNEGRGVLDARGGVYMYAGGDIEGSERL